MTKWYDKKRITLRYTDRHRPHSRQLDAEDLSELLHVSIQTAYKYINGSIPLDKSKLELLQIKAFGIIPAPGWEGFYFDKMGNLVGRRGYSINAELIEQYQLVKHLNSVLQVENKKLKDRINELEDEKAYSNVVFLPNQA